MAFNLTGFVSGFAKGASERIDQEREKEETALANRFKIAAVNKLQREKEANELRSVYADRIKNFSSAYPEAEEQEILAGVSTDVMYNNLMEAYNKGEKVDLKKHLVVNKDMIPEDFTDSLSYIDKFLTQTPAAAATAAQSRSVFGATVTPDEKTRQLQASQYGATPEELEPYAQGAGAIKDLPALGSLSTDFLKKNKSSKDRLAEANSLYTQTVIDYGEDSAEAAAAYANFNSIKAIDDKLNPTEAKWATYVSDLKLAMLKGTAEEKAAAEKEYDRVLAVEAMGDKEKSANLPSATSLNNLLGKAASDAIRKKYGSQAQKDLIIETAPDGSTSFRYVGTEIGMQQKIEQEARRTTANIAKLYLNKDGKPLNNNIAAGLLAAGFQMDDQGRIVLDQAAPEAAPAPAPEAAPAPPKAAPAAPAPDQGLPAPKTQAEYNAIPAGTKYVDTDGKTKIKK